MKRKPETLNRKSIWKDSVSWSLLLLCIPAIIGYILFYYIPMGISIIIPFKDYKFAKGILGSAWVGLKNFKWILTSTSLWRALKNTFLYGGWFMILSPITEVTLALLLYEVRSRKALKAYQTVFTFPNFMSMVVVGYVAYAILSPRNGFLNLILQACGRDPIDVYSNIKAWPIILSIVHVWKGIGMGSLMHYASLMGVDSALYEAAELDGATRFQKMWHISIPHLIPLVCIFTILNAGTLINGSFDLFYVIPRNTTYLYETTDILNTYVYRAMQDSSYSMGATVGLVQGIVGLILVVTANLIVKKISPENSMF